MTFHEWFDYVINFVIYTYVMHYFLGVGTLWEDISGLPIQLIKCNATYITVFITLHQMFICCFIKPNPH